MAPFGRFLARPVMVAAGKAFVSTFLLAHNPIYHLLFFLAPFAILASPFIGGMTARKHTTLGVVGAMFVAAMTAVATTGPFLIVIPIIWALGDLLDNTASIIGVIAQALLGVAAYSVVVSLAGIVWQARRPIASGSGATERGVPVAGAAPD
ncbi:MAG: hypothetical protein NZ518_04650 [Dehalococcoidia bacterium]|nr:hypothetical protein [Dehalococcoidia bacterium]